MKEYMYTKILGVIVGLLTILVATGFGILLFIGIGLSKAFSTGYDHSATEILTIVILLFLGLITGIGSFKLKSNLWRNFYIVYCIMVGLGFIITFFISIGSIGFIFEIFILFIGAIYILLGYLAKGKK